MNKTVLILGYVWPEIESSAAGVRNQSIVDFFLSRGWIVHYATSAHDHPARARLEQQGVQCHTLVLNHSDFDIWIRDLKPQLVWYDRFVSEEQWGWRVTENVPEATQVLDTQDLHFLRRARGRAAEQGASLDILFNGPIEFNSEEVRRELASILRVNLSLVLSDFEYQLLVTQMNIPAEILAWIPFSLGPRDAVNTLPFSERKDFAVLGNFRHAPNADGIKWLHQKLWPMIRESLPTSEVHIYGAYPSKELMALDNPKQGFRMKGACENARNTLSAYRINLAPLRFGAGIKGKIADGWAVGCPVVTTPIGAEGLANSSVRPWGGAVAKDELSFIQCAVELYSKSENWSQAQLRGFEIYDSLFSMKTISHRLADRLADKIDPVTKSMLPRSWVKEILQRELLQGRKYFSRWIELKEQKR